MQSLDDNILKLWLTKSKKCSLLVMNLKKTEGLSVRARSIVGSFTFRWQMLHFRILSAPRVKTKELSYKFKLVVIAEYTSTVE